MPARALPPAEVLRQFLSYAPETGLLSWTFDAFKKDCRKFPGTLALDTITDAGHKKGSFFGMENVRAHRVIWKMHFGNEPEEIDHIDGNPANNRIENLRAVSHSENMKNLPIKGNNTSGAMGVSWHKQRKKWRAFITYNGKQESLGLYHSLKKAMAARRRAEKKYGFHPNHGRAK